MHSHLRHHGIVSGHLGHLERSEAEATDRVNIGLILWVGGLREQHRFLPLSKALQMKVLTRAFAFAH